MIGIAARKVDEDHGGGLELRALLAGEGESLLAEYPPDTLPYRMSDAHDRIDARIAMLSGEDARQGCARDPGILRDAAVLLSAAVDRIAEPVAPVIHGE